MKGKTMKVKRNVSLLRRIIICIVLALVMPTTITMIAIASDADIMYGDIDDSNVVNANDALGVLKHAAKISLLDEKQEFIADVSGDKKIDAIDALLILKYAAKIIDRFPVEDIIAPSESTEPEESEIVETTPCETEIVSSSPSETENYPTNTPGAIVTNVPDENVYVVTFKDYDGTVIKTEKVNEGGNATPPSDPIREGYYFVGWDNSYLNINKDIIISAQYEQDSVASIIVESVNVSPGDKNVEVNVAIKNNPGILGMILSIEYDEEVMTLSGAENGEAVSDVLTFTQAKELKSGCNFVWDGQEISENEVKDGTILKLTFDISDTASTGLYDINFLYGDGNIIDGELIPVSLNVKEGKVIIQ